jgi:hypothetical protein
MDSINIVPEKGKRYNIRSRPWDSSYVELTEDLKGDWVFSPIDRTRSKKSKPKKSRQEN